MTTPAEPRTDVRSPGLRGGVLGAVDSLSIGVASTGPAYSMTATLGVVAALAGPQTAAVVVVAFVPMLFAALGYDALNRAEPDCGTSFVWVSRAFGPYLGWLAGWAIVVADVLVMASLAQVAAQYAFLLCGARGIGSDPTHPAVLATGIGFVLALTLVCVRGIGPTARLQLVLVTVETVMLVGFSVAALVRVYSTGDGPLPGSSRPAWSWFDLTSLDGGTAVSALMVMLFLYWGWDSVLSVNEETRDPRRLPGIAAIGSTVVSVAVYVLFSVSATALAGVGVEGLGLANPDHADDVVAALAPVVFGDSTWGGAAVSLLVLMVLTSAAASAQTTLLPTARTTFSMALHGALPPVFGRVHPRYGTPVVSTWAMCVASIAVYVPLDLYSGGAGIADAVTACGMAIGFYYGLTALASTALHLREPVRWRPVRTVVWPAVGGLTLLTASAWTALGSFDAGSGESTVHVPGTSTDVGAVGVLGVGSMLLGVPLMLWWRAVSPGFFGADAPRRRLPDPAAPHP